MRTDLSNPGVHKFIEEKMLWKHLGVMVRAVCRRNVAFFDLHPLGRGGPGGGDTGSLNPRCCAT